MGRFAGKAFERGSSEEVDDEEESQLDRRSEG